MAVYNEEVTSIFKTPGQIAYESYVTKTHGSSVDGKTLPSWKGLEEDKKEQWNAAALKFAVARKEIKDVLREDQSER